VTDPLGGRFGRNADGTLNGRVFEYAEYPLSRKIGELTQLQGDLASALTTFSNEALHFGITSIQAMPIEEETAFRQAWDATNSPIRLRHIFFPLVVPPLLPRPNPPPKGTNGLKWILDGTPIENGAAVRTPYPDGGGSGQQNFQSITRLLRRGLDTNQQLLLHAVGDAMVATVFKEMENITGINWPERRVRIEHADGLLPDLDTKARTLGVVAVLNPSHFFARPLFPAGGFSRAKSLLTANIPIALGSDGPLNPWLNIMLAVDRPDNRREALTREEAIAAYTLGSAFAEMQPDKGMLAPGKLADLAVLSQDVFTVPVDALPGTRSLLTIIGGKIVLDEWPSELP
jgi:predicted amidohydrolase YtcJ